MLAELSSLEQKFADVKQILLNNQSVNVVGIVGTGRSTLARRVANELDLPKIVCPSLDLDSGLHMIYQLGAALNDDTAFNRDLGPRGRADTLARNCSKPLVICLPGGWHDGGNPETRELRDILNALLSSLKQYVLFSDKSAPRGGLSPAAEVRLRPVSLRLEQLENEELWGEASPEARDVSKLVGRTVSPIVARLAVGAKILKCDFTIGGDQVDPFPAAAALMSRILPKLRERSSLFSATLRLALSRCSVEKEYVSADLAPTENIFITQCLGYGDGDSVKMSEPVKRAFLTTLKSCSQEQADSHHDLALYSSDRDGAREPGGLSQLKVFHWLETYHHLAHGGPDSQTQWQERIEAWSETPQLVERARSLSRDYHQFEQAAELFERCLESEGSSYCWHYLGYNLHKAGIQRERAREAYERALEMEPGNPWWSRRYITFLMENAQFRAARTVYDSHIDKIKDSFSGESGAVDYFLKLAAAWLSHARPDDARAALKQFASLYGGSNIRFKKLDQKCEHMLEVAELGAEVYHPDLPIGERRQTTPPPALVRRVSSPATLRTYFPARVLDRDAENVEVELLDVGSGRVFKKKVGSGDWERGWNEPALEARGFYFLGVREDNELVIVPQMADNEPFSPQPGKYWESWLQ